MTRTSVAIVSFLAVAACTTATVPTTWTRPDGRAIDPTQLKADKTICQGKMEQAEIITNARALVPIYLPGEEVHQSNYITAVWRSTATRLLGNRPPPQIVTRELQRW